MEGAHIISSLGGLIDSKTASAAHKVRVHAQGLDELQGGSGIKASSGVVPALEGASTESYFGDGDTLAFSARNTANEVVADLGVDGVRETKYGHDDIPHVLRILLAGHIEGTDSGGTRLSGEFEGISDGELGEMNCAMLAFPSVFAPGVKLYRQSPLGIQLHPGTGCA
jgi:hypothetical protein